jgi:hypothetical protein
MEQITQEEIDRTLQNFETFTEKEVQKFVRTFEKKQEPLLVYIAAVAEREEFNEEEYDLFFTMALLSWDVIRSRFPKIKKLQMEQLQQLDEALFDALEKDPVSMLTMVFEDHPQPQLLGTILQCVLNAQEAVREEQRGTIYFASKNILDGLIHASGKS